MFNLLPKDTVFYDLFEGLARHAVSSAEHLRQLAKHYPDSAEHVQRIRDEEHAADNLAHQALDRLDRTFITPFDREDIHELIGGLDDIIDNIDALAKRFALFHIKTMETDFQKQADVLVQATVTLSDAVHKLRKSRKLSELSEKLIAIHHSESVGDDNHHAAMSRLFSGGTEALEVVKWKELYDLIEESIDNCEDVGNTLERIVLKNG
jgi:predicted phosphate transport protein (TIGR00153 family)